MPVAKANGIEICYAQDGCIDDPPVLLIHGIGAQLVQWPQSFIDGLVTAGFNVIRMDNRDAGRSTKLDQLGGVDLLALFRAFQTGAMLPPPYTLQSMAGDAAELLEAIGCESAHIVGASMGGMIAQRIALHHPGRVTSLTSIMSSSGAPDLPPPDPAAIGSLMAIPPLNAQRGDVIAHLRSSWNLLGGPHYLSTELGMGRLVEAAYDRGRHPAGFLRQMCAIMADGARAEKLPTIVSPTLVLHGDSDPLVPLACGEDTARRIPGARLVVLPRMGHDLPEPLMPEILRSVVEHLRTAPLRR